jgi:hypothetical protein
MADNLDIDHDDSDDDCCCEDCLLARTCSQCQSLCCYCPVGDEYPDGE